MVVTTWLSSLRAAKSFKTQRRSASRTSQRRIPVLLQQLECRALLSSTAFDGAYTGTYVGSVTAGGSTNPVPGFITDNSIQVSIVNGQVAVYVPGIQGTGNGTIADNGTFSVSTSGSIGAVVYAGTLTNNNGVITGSGTWTIVDEPSLSGNGTWALSPLGEIVTDYDGHYTGTYSGDLVTPSGEDTIPGNIITDASIDVVIRNGFATITIPGVPAAGAGFVLANGEFSVTTSGTLSGADVNVRYTGQFTLSPFDATASAFGSFEIVDTPGVTGTGQWSIIRDTPTTHTIDLPSGGGTYDLLGEGSEVILRDSQGTELFRTFRTAISELTVNGSDSDDQLRVDAGSVNMFDGQLVFNGGNDTSTGDSLDIHDTRQWSWYNIIDSETDSRLYGQRYSEEQGLVSEMILVTWHQVELVKNRLQTTYAGAIDLDFSVDQTVVISDNADRNDGCLRLNSSASDCTIETYASGGSDEYGLYVFLGVGNDSAEIHGALDKQIGTRYIYIDGYDGNDTLTGGDGNDALFGGSGDDVLSGGNGDDVLGGNSDEDGDYLVEGRTDNDTLYGGNGADEVYTNIHAYSSTLTNGSFDAAGTDSISGFERAFAGRSFELTFFDYQSLLIDASNFSGSVTLHGGGGNDTLIGGAFADELQGHGGNDSLLGLGGNDTLFGSEGNDVLRGGGGSDSLVGNEGNDSLYGQGAVDTLDGGSGVDLLDGGTSGLFLADQIDGSVTMTNTGYLTAGGDRAIAETFGGITLSGGDGNDNIDINGFTACRVTVYGGNGDDSVLGGAGVDLIYGGSGNDVLLGGGGADIIYGQDGNDTVNGGGASDILSGGFGDDRIVGGTGDNILREEVSGTSTLTTTAGVQTLTGAGTDAIIGSFVAAMLTGVGSNNTIDVTAFVGTTTLIGSNGNDILLGGASRDVLYGGPGNDSLVGGGGADSLFGESGDDILQGGAGNDLLRGSQGTDSIDGGADTDRISEQGNTDFVVNGLQVSSAETGTDTAANIERIELSGGSGANLLDARLATVPVLLNGGTGNDSLFGGAFADELVGGSGDDVLSGGAGQDILNGGVGNDTVYEKANTNFVITNRRLTSAATGNETGISIEGFVLVGGAGNNTLDARLSAISVTLLGAGGNDTLYGSAFADVLVGGSRTVTPASNGGDGVDSLDGGAGVDLYDNDPLDTRSALQAGETAIGTVFAGLPSWLDQI